MKTSILQITLSLLMLLNVANVYSQVLGQTGACEYDSEDLEIAYISVQGIDSIPVLLVKECKDYLFSEEFVLFYDLDFDNIIEEIEEGVFIGYSLFNNSPSQNEKCFILSPFTNITTGLNVIFYAIIDEDYFNQTF